MVEPVRPKIPEPTVEDRLRRLDRMIITLGLVADALVAERNGANAGSAITAIAAIMNEDVKAMDAALSLNAQESVAPSISVAHVP